MITMERRNNLLFFLIALSIIGNCRIDSQNISIAGFSDTKWKMDSLGCNGYRERNFNIIKEFFQEKNSFRKEAIVTFLGKSNNYEYYNLDESIVCYFVSKGPQCIGDMRQSVIDAKTTILVFHFNRDETIREVIASSP
jgi:hypothetical protein